MRKFLSNYKINNIILLSSIGIYLFILPFISEPTYRLLSEIFFITIFIFAALSVGKYFRNLLIISIITVTIELVSITFGFEIIELIARAMNIIFFLLITALMIVNVAKRETANFLTILESINGYLLLGMAFTIIVVFIQIINPEAYDINMVSDGKIALIDIIYYTFVTMSTLGYGDMLPVANYAKSTAVLISVSGQIYIAVIVAMLVGKLASKKSSN